MNTRTQRVNAEVQKALAKIISSKLRDPRIKTFITVVKTEVSPDLSHCKVFVSILSKDNNEKQQTFEILQSSAPYLRKCLSGEVKMRITPELHFFLDDTLEEGDRMEKLISSLNIPKEN